MDRGLGEIVAGSLHSSSPSGSGSGSGGGSGEGGPHSEPPTLRLFFEPKGRAHADDQYYTR